MQSEHGEKESNVIFFIADISGYTKFIVSNEKALLHSQIIIKDIISALIEQVELPLEILKLEGDAIFLYVNKDNREHSWDEIREVLFKKLLTIFHIFAHKISELTLHKICTCNACNNVENLSLKIVAHSGKTVFYQVGNILEITGKDAIIVHRLLKNSVEADEYFLMTETAFEDLKLDINLVELGEEIYEELGTIKTYIYYPPPEDPSVSQEAFEYSQIFVETLRAEVSGEYATVAQTPELGFHFHTGSRLTEMLDYGDELLHDLSEKVIESFAGTGNPFSLGLIRSGARVLDMGSGAGLDAIIASRMVGSEGEVFGVDMTPQMVAKARSNAELAGRTNVKFQQGYNEQLPLPDQWADIIISNGAVNLSPNKSIVFAEMFRVLKPGGHIMIADILIEKPIPLSAKNNIDLWSG